MDGLFAPPVATTFEAVSAIVSALIYLGVGVAAFARAPRDVRTRVFFATALASAGPYSVTTLLWARGSGAAFLLPVMIVVGVSLMLGSLTLFHFTQVFPWRRPWIRAHWRWLLAGYIVTPVAAALSAGMIGAVFAAIDTSGSGGLGAVSSGISEGLVLLILLVVIPAVFVLGLVVPFAALLSLYNSWRAANAAGIHPAQVTTLWILISQMAGGVLTILIIPLLHLVAPTGPWATIAGALLFAFGLLMPLAFAAGVWKYRVLDLDIDAAPAQMTGRREM
ncbi:MAG TPA: hypothetical protein VNC21_07910 [Vicinamibacterales bacterium]|nr:hypothetical protein [Vicinamibacterales bacterium]